MNPGLADSFQMASGGVLYTYTGHAIISFAHMPATTHVSNHTRF